MEYYKKYGKSSWAKHLRNDKKSPFTKQMANKKSRTKSAQDLRAEQEDTVLLMSLRNEFDLKEWTW